MSGRDRCNILEANECGEAHPSLSRIYGGKRATTAQLKRRYELDQHPVRCLCSNRRWLGSASRESSEPSIPAAARQLCWSVPFRGSTAGSHGAMCASSTLNSTELKSSQLAAALGDPRRLWSDACTAATTCCNCACGFALSVWKYVPNMSLNGRCCTSMNRIRLSTLTLVELT